MLVRSSSTPVGGTFLSSVSDHSSDDHWSSHCSKSISSYNLPFQHCSPVSKDSRCSIRANSLRRVSSDGHLIGLPSETGNISQFGSLQQGLDLPVKSVLETLPSLSVYSKTQDLKDLEGECADENVPKHDGSLLRSVTIGESIETQFSFGKAEMRAIQEECEEVKEISGLAGVDQPMYLASGVGIDGDVFGLSDQAVLKRASASETADVEAYLKKMVDEHPSHPLFLRNYAQFLLAKGDFRRAEDYLYRATLADPDDGEIILEYAKMIWAIHGDRDQASTYYESAANISPKDSNVLAAYASFLWETEDDETENIPSKSQKQETESEESRNVEDHYKQLVLENPSNPLLLRNYARFLYQSKGDLLGAEEWYRRVIGDGEVLALYAKLSRELHKAHQNTSLL